MPAVAALPLVILAILAVLLIYAFTAFGKAVQSLIPKSGFPGAGFLHNAVGYAIALAQALIDDLFAPAMIHVVNFILAPLIAWQKTVNALETMGAELYQTIIDTRNIIPIAYQNLLGEIAAAATDVKRWASGAIDLVNKSIIRYYGYATAYADRVGAAASASIIRWYGYGTQYADRIGAAASASIIRWYGYATAYTDRAVAGITASIAHAVTTAAAYTDAKIAGLVTHVDQQVAAGVIVAEQQAVAAAGVLITDVEGTAAQAISAVWPDVVAGVKGAEGAIDGGLDDILAGLRNIDLTVPADLAGIAAATGALTIPMLRYLKECGIPNCRNLSSLGRDLQALLGMVEDAAFIGLIVGMISDPAGTAHEIDDVLGGLANDTISEAKSLLGVG